MRQGDVRVDIIFPAALGNSINVIGNYLNVVAMAELENILEIDRSRNVLFDFKSWKWKDPESNGSWEKIQKCRSMFLGVFQCYRLPTCRPTGLKVPALLVCNTDPHDAPVARRPRLVPYLENENYGEFFDSIGRPPDAPFRTFLNDNCRHLIFNDRHL